MIRSQVIKKLTKLTETWNKEASNRILELIGLVAYWRETAGELERMGIESKEKDIHDNFIKRAKDKSDCADELESMILYGYEGIKK